jgi:hypothetical protein
MSLVELLMLTMLAALFAWRVRDALAAWRTRRVGPSVAELRQSMVEVFERMREDRDRLAAELDRIVVRPPPGALRSQVVELLETLRS